MVEIKSAMKKFIIIIFLLLSPLASAASEFFMVGASSEKLLETYKYEVVELRNTQRMGFKTCIENVNCVIIYTMENNVAISATCLVQTQNLRFLRSIKDFTKIVNQVIKNGVVSDIDIRFNEAKKQESSERLARPPNYIRISGKWREGYFFSARLDGDEITDVNKAGVCALGVTIYPKEN